MYDCISVFISHLQGQLSVEDRIQRQVIVADSLLYQAILVFTGQDIPSYVKGRYFHSMSMGRNSVVNNIEMHLSKLQLCVTSITEGSR